MAPPSDSTVNAKSPTAHEMQATPMMRGNSRATELLVRQEPSK